MSGNSFKLISAMICSLFLTSNAFARDTLVLKEGSFVALRGEVSSESVAKVAAEVLSSKNDEVTLFISSPGGSILDGLQLMQILKDSGKKTTCIAATAASMAFIIFQACDVRLVLDNSVLMQHVATYGVQGQAPNNVSMMNFISRLITKIDEDQAKKLGLTLAEFRAKTRDDWWLFGSEIVENKAADETASVTCSRELAAKKVKEIVDLLFFKFEVTYSGCPLIEGPLAVKAVEKVRIGIRNERAEQEYDEFMESVFYRRTLERKMMRQGDKTFY